jgi:hypothetical protein
MSAEPRNADKMNTLAIAVIGVCSAALVYVSIVLLQAFYSNDIADVSTMADYGGQDRHYQTVRAEQMNNISSYVNVMATESAPAKHQLPIDRAIELVAADAKKDASTLVPAIGRAAKPTVMPIFGRPKPLPAPAPPTPVVPAAPVDTVAPAPAVPTPAARNDR